MIYSREKHWKFLERELKAQTDAFKQKLETPALFLLQEKEELFVAQFVKIENGEMILRFPNTRGLPRQGEYLYCFTVPKELRNFRKWDNKTYGDLVKAKTNFTETICIWQMPTDNVDFSLLGFRGVDVEFANDIQNAQDIILLLGPNTPPFEYIANIQEIIPKTNFDDANRILDQDFSPTEFFPVPIDSKKNIVDFILSQLSLRETIIIQGPPGTGKTHLIAQISELLCNEGKTVLVTALTNRALIEIAEKPPLCKLLLEKRILKTKISVDEFKSLPDLQVCKSPVPQKGSLVLSTFFITSSQAKDVENEPPFDYVIVDEASQSLLGMCAIAKILGRKNILIGDTKQLPPVTAISDDILNRYDYWSLVDGLKALSNANIFPYFQLTESHRLTIRAANYTSLFYNNILKSKIKSVKRIDDLLPFDIGRMFHPEGGPSLIKTDLQVGELKPINALLITTQIVGYLLKFVPDINVAVLTYFVDTTKALQKAIFQNVGYHKRLLIETVSRVQGLTTDVCIFVVPNTSYHRSLESRLFNVATSRSRLNTIIVTDQNILKYGMADKLVQEYLEMLDREFSFTVIPNGSTVKYILNE